MHKNFRKNRKTVRQILNHHFDRFGKCDRIKMLASHLKMPTLFFEKKDEEKIMIPERLAALREKMRAYGVDAYLVPTADYHESEYVGTYFKARTYISQALPVLPEPPLLPRMKRASGPTAATSYRQPKSLPEPALL